MNRNELLSEEEILNRLDAFFDAVEEEIIDFFDDDAVNAFFAGAF